MEMRLQYMQTDLPPTMPGPNERPRSAANRAHSSKNRGGTSSGRWITHGSRASQRSGPHRGITVIVRASEELALEVLLLGIEVLTRSNLSCCD